MRACKLRSDRADNYYNYRFRELRLSAGLTKEELGRHVGRCAGSISHYERLRAWPSGEIAEKITRVLSARLNEGLGVDEVFPEQIRYIADERAHARTVEKRKYPEPKESAPRVYLEELPRSEREKILAGEREDVVAQECVQAGVREVLSVLPDRTREVLMRKYGLWDGNPQTYAGIGRVLGLSREGARQIGLRALKRLQRAGLRRRLEEVLGRV